MYFFLRFFFLSYFFLKGINNPSTAHQLLNKVHAVLLLAKPEGLTPSRPTQNKIRSLNYFKNLSNQHFNKFEAESEDEHVKLIKSIINNYWPLRVYAYLHESNQEERVIICLELQIFLLHSKFDTETERGFNLLLLMSHKYKLYIIKSCHNNR